MRVAGASFCERTLTTRKQTSRHEKKQNKKKTEETEETEEIEDVPKNLGKMLLKE